MLEQVLMYLNNWFLVDIYEGTYTIQGGSITLPFLKDDQYFRILGSVFNDGLHQYPDFDLADEEFSGVVWALAVPLAIISLTTEIEAWQKKNGAIVSSPYTSESFGGYSYTKAANESTGAALTWQGIFASRLNPYKKPRELSYVRPSRPPAPIYTRPFNPDFPWR